MSRLCMIFALTLLPTTVSATSRLQTLCTQKSGQWFNPSQTCVVLSSASYIWDNGWDYCSSFVDTVNGSDAIKGRLAQLISESERTSLLDMVTAASEKGVFLGVGAFVSGSANAADWNWCDTKACGRDGGQAKHPITIDMSGATLGGGKKDCGEMKKNDPKIKRIEHQLTTSNNVNHRFTKSSNDNHRFIKSNDVNHRLTSSDTIGNELTITNFVHHRLTKFSNVKLQFSKSNYAIR
uniref:C-type lectin domain-containing protein n=1 Tax=Plectus sambesii TaxID=2011161 RepID=A0A914UQW4_9BILA